MTTTALDSPSAQHIDRVIGDCLAGVPGRDPAIRLEAAALLAEILDRSQPKMTAHMCTVLDPQNCYRCDLNIDEMRTIKRRDYKATTRLWGRCEGCGCTWRWNGKTEDVKTGLSAISRSSCMCGRRTP